MFSFLSRRRILTSALALVATTGVSMSLMQNPLLAAEKDDTSSLKGKQAPAFSLKELGGRQVNSSELGGRVVLIDFWATWCPPCVKSLPHVNELAGKKELAEQGLVVLAVNAREQAPKIQQFLNDKGMKNLIVPIDTDGGMMNKYLVQGIPTTVVINRDGTIADVFVGSGNDSNIDASIAKALAVKAPEAKPGKKSK